VLDAQQGRLAVVDLQRNSIVGTWSVNGTPDDVLFSTDSGALYLAGKDRPGISVIDVDKGSIHEFEGSGELSFTGLSRSPNGRDGFGKRTGSNEILEFDLRRQKLARSLDVTLDTSFAFVTGTGRFILLPDNRRRELRIATTDPLEIVATLKGSSTMDAAYSAWFDSLAYVTSPAEHRLLIYDLDHLSRLGELRLDGTPGAALVGPGGDKLFVPLVDAKAVEVINTGSQRVAAHIPLDANPTTMALASAYGICH
jgi:DNA-binding beta-propeller fold protein YncE